jgi:hypothetical protein
MELHRKVGTGSSAFTAVQFKEELLIPLYTTAELVSPLFRPVQEAETRLYSSL